MLSCNQTSEKPYSFRIGSLILNSIGQLLPHQVQAFHTRDAVYPVSVILNSSRKKYVPMYSMLKVKFNVFVVSVISPTSAFVHVLEQCLLLSDIIVN